MKGMQSFDKQEKNLFNVEEEFFIIDSEKLKDVTARLYGFCLQGCRIVENNDLQDRVIINPTGHGVYVYVQRDDDKITIHQDFNGSYGIYLFRKDDAFVLSNSFLRLVDYVKTRYVITMNEDYARHFLISDLCSVAYSETMINEIELISKNAVVEIDCKKQELSLRFIDYNENTIELDSVEGMEILDRWYTRWTRVLQSIKAETNSIMIALSGGFDSRLTFMLALKSGINLDEVQITSINDKLHTHAEDYEIASQIADYYKFKLNRGNLKSEGINYSLEDIINISFYTKLTFHKQMYYKHKKFRQRRFSFPGSGGECIRSYWDVTQDEFLRKQIENANVFSPAVTEQLVPSFSKIVESAFDKIGKKHNLIDSDSTEYCLNLYRETRCRNHFGKAAVEDYFGNTFVFSPLMDPDLHMLRLSDNECVDKNLLVALIYVRYCRKLLDFKFEGGREIDKKTIEHAEKINAKYPFVEPEIRLFSKKIVTEIDCEQTEKGVLVQKNKQVPIDAVSAYITKLVESSKFRHMFLTFMDDEIYRFAMDYAKKTKFHPLRNYYTLIAITKILNDTYVNESIRHNSMEGFLRDFSKDTDTIAKRELYEIINSVGDYITARVDVKITDREFSDLKLIAISDNRAKIKKPDWYQQGGTGYVIESYNLYADMVFKCVTSGKLRIALKGRDVRDEERNRIPCWIDYSKFQYNEKVIFDDIRPAWHDKPIVYIQQVNEGEVVKLHVEWRIHSIDNMRGETMAEVNKEKINIEDNLNKLNKRIDMLEEKINRIGCTKEQERLKFWKRNKQ